MIIPDPRVFSAPPVPQPLYRRLRGYAFDPSLSLKLSTAEVNELVFHVPFEDNLQQGPVGEYLEVIDYDPASNAFYEPVNLDESVLLAQDGLPPSEGNPQFHQQMVYAVAMTTIRNFERATGNLTLWRQHQSITKEGTRSEYVQRLRIYPHALREANAYYSPAKEALLFGYFPASAQGVGGLIPGGTVFTCLSHDIIAHETAHALLDGYLGLSVEPSNPDSLAFHEAFADIVALFQHFSFPEVLRHQIAYTRGNLASQNLLGMLAQQFGQATGRRGALRDAIGRINAETGQWERLIPDPNDYMRVREPHARGALLVAAVFDAFLSIYEVRSADLLRIATGGSGVLPAGALQPDLVNRLAQEAAKAAQHVLIMCMRGLTCLPPVDFTFGDYLRSIITADLDLVPRDELGYRIAMIDAFSRRGIYPRELRTLSVDSLRWPQVSEEAREIFSPVARALHDVVDWSALRWDRKRYFERIAYLKKLLHENIRHQIANPSKFERLTGLILHSDFSTPNNLQIDHLGMPNFEVGYVCPSQKIGPDGTTLKQISIAITQSRTVPPEPTSTTSQSFLMRGGCTLILDQDSLDLVYCLARPVDDSLREERKRQYLQAGHPYSFQSEYISDETGEFPDEPFALLHREY